MQRSRSSRLRAGIPVVLALLLAPLGACNALLDNEQLPLAVSDSGSPDAQVSSAEGGADVVTPHDSSVAPDVNVTPERDAQADAKADASASDANVAPDAAVTCQADLLHDPANCGSCGHSCLESLCVQGLCDPHPVVAFDSGIKGLNDLVVTADAVYFTAWCTWAELFKATLPSSGLTAVGSGGDCGCGLAKDGDLLYYGNVVGNQPTPPGIKSEIYRVGTQGGTLVPIATYPGEIRRIRADATDLFFTINYGDTGVYRVTRAGGGTPTPLYKGETYGMVVTGEDVYVGGGMAGIVHVQKTGGSARTLYPPVSNATSIAVDATHVYWVDEQDKRVYRGARDKSGRQCLTPNVLDYTPKQIAIDDTSVYIGGDPGAPIAAVNKDGSNYRVLVNGGTIETTNLTVSGDYVYYAQGVNTGAGIWRVAK